MKEAGPFDGVVHAAAAIAHDADDTSVSLVNCVGTQRVVSLARQEGARLVFISGVTVAGRPLRLPVDEEHPPGPTSAYLASKLYGEELAKLAGAQVPAASLRLTSPVGPRMPGGRIMSVFVQKALAGEPLEVAGRGTRGQDYVDVRDAAHAVLACLEREVKGVYNVAAGRCVTNAELARRCVELFDSESEIRLGGRSDPEEGVRWEVSIEKAAAAFGYRPAYSLDDSLRAVASVPERGLAKATSRSPRRDELRK
jgi:UDP-glucose 4-epimerase